LLSNNYIQLGKRHTEQINIAKPTKELGQWRFRVSDWKTDPYKCRWEKHWDASDSEFFVHDVILGIRRAVNENTKTKHLTRAKSASDVNYSIEKDATVKLLCSLCICAARKMSMTMTDAFVCLQ
jgi:hypothetical protein